jgi:RNA polymerase sigma-70 factor (ECF subfamily)
MSARVKKPDPVRLADRLGFPERQLVPISEGDDRMIANLADPRHPEASVAQRLDQARSGDSHSLGALLQVYRNYLLVLASNQLDRRLRQRMNPSDLVQETMLAAHRDFPDFRGRSEGEFTAWLRKILVHSVGHAVETHLKARKRDIRREAPQCAGNGQSDGGPSLVDFVSGRDSTPSEIFGRTEAAMQLTQQLAKLKPEYRDVIMYRNLQGLPFDEVAEKMGRKTSSIRMLWLRAIEKFKETCVPIE